MKSQKKKLAKEKIQRQTVTSQPKKGLGRETKTIWNQSFGGALRWTYLHGGPDITHEEWSGILGGINAKSLKN